jgi:glucose/arabinose dehydrogenase
MGTSILLRRSVTIVTLAFAAGCGRNAHLSVGEGTGPTPMLPAPSSKLIPTINVAKAKPWRGDAKPTAAPGTVVNAFSRGLTHPRWLYVLPNGDVLVAETNAPKRPDDNTGIRGFFFRLFMKKAGGAVPSPDRITLLRDTTHDGVADMRTVFVQGLSSPFGMALVGRTLYVANTDALVRFDYAPDATSLAGTGTKVLDLPAGTINHHWTKNLIASPDGKKLYVAIGSNSNAGDHGIAAETDRARIWEVDVATGSHRVFASGLRNPVGMAWDSTSGALWVAVNERDELGGDLVPDYMTALQDGAFYGFPWSYFGAHVDQRVKPPQPDKVASAVTPDYALGPHTASLGLVSTQGSSLPAPFTHGMFVGQHGSWNRKPASGYKVVFVPFDGGKPSGGAIDVLTGFINDHGEAYGRPVGVAIDKTGALLVADDVGNTVWRVSKTGATAFRP